MKLKFFAKGDHLVTVPGYQPVLGQHLRRVGRAHIPAEIVDKKVVKAASSVATEKPYEVDSETPAGQRLIKLARRDGSLWAADQATANECGIAFVDLEFQNGVWSPKAAKPADPVVAAPKGTDK